MKELKITTENSRSVIYCGSSAFSAVAGSVTGQLFIVTDSNVDRLYGKLIGETFPDVSKFVIKAGERSKTSATLLKILKAMLGKGMRRNCTVVAFGGGVTGDIAGLAASLYMRGVRLVQIPTTLLAQVDSSVGGKTAVDMDGVKNVIGAFYQPEKVIADPMFLRTLPKREIICGLGEIVKYAALDGGIYKKLLKNANRLNDYGFLEEIIYDCIAHKADVVSRDEHDISGARKSLNLGHTTGHALELFYGGKSHGEYVLIGTYFELQIARKLNICGDEYADNLEKLILKAIKKIPRYTNISEAAKYAVHDKKNVDDKISLIVPKCEGECAEVKTELSEYCKYLEEIAESI